MYSAAVIISEIDDISRFSSKEKFASYAGLVPKQYQSGNKDIRGHFNYIFNLGTFRANINNVLD